jgi:hypothetical protein
MKEKEMQDEKTMQKEYEQARAEYLQDSFEVRKSLNTFALSLIAAMWVLLDRGIAAKDFLSTAVFLLAISTLGLNLYGKVARVRHWRAVILHSSLPLRYDSTIWGRLTNLSWYLALFCGTLSAICFVIILLR